MCISAPAARIPRERFQGTPERGWLDRCGFLAGQGHTHEIPGRVLFMSLSWIYCSSIPCLRLQVHAAQCDRRGVFTMKKHSMLLLLVMTIGTSLLRAQTPIPNGQSVIKLDPALDALVSPDAKLVLVKGGFGFTEGTVWVQKGTSGYLLLSDMYANVIYKVTSDGKVSLYLDHSGYTGYDIWRVGMPQPDANRKDVFFMIGSNGLALDRPGRLLIATWSGRSIDRIEKDGKRTIVADRYEGKRFGGTNDLVVKKDGAIYFTD